MFNDALVSGAILAAIVVSGAAVLLGSGCFAYWACMGNNPEDGRFRFAAGAYALLALVLTGVGLTLVAAFWMRVLG